MKRSVLQALAALFAGALFGIGLAASGMTRPEKVIGFLDVTGDWDASLLFVMVSAIAVHFTAYRLIRGWSAPLYASTFAIPTRRNIDLALVLGAALFGVGWGLGGYCPGPGVVSLGSGTAGAVVFTGAMLVGMFVTSTMDSSLQPKPAILAIKATDARRRHLM